MVLAPIQFSGRSLTPDVVGGIQQGQQVLQGENILETQRQGIEATQRKQGQQQQASQLIRRQQAGEQIQTGSELAQLMVDNPQLAENVLKASGISTEFQKNDLAQFGFQLEQAGPAQQQQLIQQRIQAVQARGGNPQDTAALVGADPQKVGQFARTVQLAALSNEERLKIAQGGKRGLASAKTLINPDGSTIQALPNGQVDVRNPAGKVVTGDERLTVLKQAAEQQRIKKQQEADIKVGQAGGEAAAKAEVKLETEPEIQARVKQASTEAAKKEIREQASIDRGLTAADSTANIRRAISLLDTVATGGVDAVRVRAKQIFGIEGADEGELSSNLGKSIVAQLRETFGAAFTKSEGDKLERIEAAFGKSPAANRRLLNNTLKTMERLATRGLEAAESRQDDFAIQSISEALTFELGDETTTTRRIKFDAQGNIVQ